MEIFKTVPQTDYLKFFHDDSGILDARRAADFLGLSRNDLANIMDANIESVRFDDRMSFELKETMMALANLCELVAQYFSGNQTKTKTWFMMPNPTLNNRRPIDLIKDGEIEQLGGKILQCLSSKPIQI